MGFNESTSQAIAQAKTLRLALELG